MERSLPETLTAIQIGLFALPILSLFGLGVYLLLRPVNVINQRWYLLVIAPLLVVNPIFILEDTFNSEGNPSLGWRFWLVLVVDILLLEGITWRIGWVWSSSAVLVWEYSGIHRGDLDVLLAPEEVCGGNSFRLTLNKKMGEIFSKRSFFDLEE